MFIKVKVIKKWHLFPITGKLTFKVVETKHWKLQHKIDKWHVKVEEAYISKKTVLTDKPLDECERFIFLKEHNKSTK